MIYLYKYLFITLCIVYLLAIHAPFLYALTDLKNGVNLPNSGDFTTNNLDPERKYLLNGTIYGNFIINDNNVSVELESGRVDGNIMITGFANYPNLIYINIHTGFGGVGGSISTALGTAISLTVIDNTVGGIELIGSERKEIRITRSTIGLLPASVYSMEIGSFSHIWLNESTIQGPILLGETANVTIDKGSIRGLVLGGNINKVSINGLSTVVFGNIVMGDRYNSLVLKGDPSILGYVEIMQGEIVTVPGGTSDIDFFRTQYNRNMALQGNRSTITVDTAEMNGNITVLSGTLSIYAKNYGVIYGNITNPNGFYLFGVTGSLYGNINSGKDSNYSLDFFDITGDITLQGKTLFSVRGASTITGIIQQTQDEDTQINFNNTQVNGITTIPGSALNKVTLRGITTINGNLSLLGTVDANISDTTVTGTFTIGNNNDTVNLTNTTIQNGFIIGGGSNTITIRESTINTMSANNTSQNTFSIFNSTITTANLNNNISHNAHFEDSNITNLHVRNSTIDMLGTTIQTINSANDTFTIDNSDITTFNIQDSTVNMSNSRIQNILGTNAITLIARDSQLNSLIVQTLSSVTLENSVINSLEMRSGVNILSARLTTLRTLIANGNSTNTMAFFDTTVDVLDLRNSTNTIDWTNGTLGQLITNPTQRQDMIFYSNTFLSNEEYRLGTGTLTLEGTISLVRATGAVNMDTLIQGDTFIIGPNGTFNLLQGGYTSLLTVDFPNMINNNPNSVFMLYTDLVTGDSTRLNLASVTNYIGGNNIVQVNPVISVNTGSPLERIDELVISSPSIVPVLDPSNSVLGGYMYMLLLNPDPAKPNTYDLVRVSMSATNYGYLAAYAGLLEYNESIWRNITSHIQEELQMGRNKDGTKKLQDDFGYYSMFNEESDVLDLEDNMATNGMSLWARAYYSHSKKKGVFGPSSQNNSMNVLTGLDLSSVPIGKNTSLYLQFLAGMGYIAGDFSNIEDSGINFNTLQTAFNVGGTIGIEVLSLKGRGKFFLNGTVWYTMVNNELTSNVFREKNRWNNDSITAILSMGYSVYAKKFLITPQIDVYYTNIMQHKYIASNGTIVDFSSNSIVMGRASLLLGYNAMYGLTPYIRGGIEMPLLETSGDRAITIAGESMKNIYMTNEFTADATIGIAYRGGINRIFITISGEVSMLFGKKERIEAGVQLGFNF